MNSYLVGKIRYTFYMSKNIIHISDIEQKPFPAPMPEEVKEKYEGAVMGFIGPRIGALKLGYNVTTLPPGKRAFPFHNHRVNEEMFFVLEGTGEVRIGSEKFTIKQGDFIACPPGGEELAHQIINTSDKDLKYLSVSTKLYPEIADYPDSGKFGILTDKFRYVGRIEKSLDYWEGE
jgi:uncharacterized cupin superfamily protein